MAQVMDRGDGAPTKKGNLGLPSLQVLADASRIEIRHARRGKCQELLCCITKSDYKYFIDDKKVAESTEEFNFCNRLWLAPHHAWEMTVTEPNSEEELIDIDRPLRCWSPFPFKCCCFQEAAVSSGDEDLGEIRETCYVCVPQYKIYDDDDETVYLVKPPTCCGGMCVDFFTEGNPCTYGCLKLPFRIYSADAEDTNGDAPFVGKMLKIPKTSCGDTFNEVSYVEVYFPKEATTDQKGLILGSSLLINSLYFEGSE